jgi:hypothetical protein
MRRLLTLILIPVATVITGAYAPAGEAAPSFTSKPKATRKGEKVTIVFTVSAPTDVAVYILDSKGEVIRHLVAGVLGKNPPKPLKPGLSQEIEWDGKANYGKTAKNGPFKIRVGLGLSVKYDRIVHSSLPDLRATAALTVAPDGRVYASVSRIFSSASSRSRWRIFGRDGSFQGSWGIPPSAEAARYFGWTSSDGRPDPLNFRGANINAEWVFQAGPGSNALVIGRDGRDMFQLAGVGQRGKGKAIKKWAPHINRYPLTTEIPGNDKFRVDLEGIGATCILGTGLKPQGCLAMSSDGKKLFVGGLAGGGKKKIPLAAVYSVKCPERTNSRVFFGDPAKPGNDEKSLGGAPGGLVADGQGRLFVTDTKNNRVVVIDEKTGRYLGQINVPTPERLGYAPKSGALYVLCSAGRRRFALNRFNPPKGSNPQGWKALKPSASMSVARSYHGTISYIAVDGSASPNVIWIGGGWSRTLRIEDPGTGAKFGSNRFMPEPRFKGKPAISDPYHRWPDIIPFGNLQVDRARKEIYFRNGRNGSYHHRFVEKTGVSELVNFPVVHMQGGGTGLQIVPAANGNIYGLQWPRYFYQWDHSGKALPWKEPRKTSPEELKNFGGGAGKSNYKMRPHEAYSPVSMSMLPHMLGTRWSDGHLFVFEPHLFPIPTGARTHKTMQEYLPSGKRVTSARKTVIWKLSDAAVGPRFDAAGNIYVAEAVRPSNWIVPEKMAKHFTSKGVAVKPTGKRGGHYTRYNGALGMSTLLYGSIIKFTPKGGMVHWNKNRKKGPFGCGQEPYVGEPQLDSSLKTTEVDFVTQGAYLRTGLKVTGAEWVHPGIGHIGFYRCNCENITFDVDEFGRVFFPDVPQFQIRVIDTNGNPLTSFGDYGDANCMGPDSPVIDPGTKMLRPRQATDPEDLKSPFAEPEIAFSWLLGVGVTDDYAYMGDSLNQRLLRAKMTYAADETCAIK